MTWVQTAKRYLTVFEIARENVRRGIAPSIRCDRFREQRPYHTGKCGWGIFLSLCDSTGVIQHSVHSVPDRYHGYCVDDNGGAPFLFSCTLFEIW